MRIIEPRLENASLLDPSPLHRPESKYADLNEELRTNKDESQFRNYEDNIQTNNVKRTYTDMHTNQCVRFVKDKKAQWCNFDHAEMTVMEAIFMLDDLIDESDPDTDLPNSVHAFQTAERIRRDHPDEDWFHLTGLIHDLGKVMALWGEPQWCVVGDTFPVGCKFQDSCVFPETFANNPDYTDSRYNTELGVYKPNCGLDEVLMSWGHDEYLYRLLVHNGSTLPAEGLRMVRYHSFYPYHSGGDYRHLTNETDEKMLPWILEFNKYDLYSKSDGLPDIEALKPYYQSLIDKYLPGILHW